MIEIPHDLRSRVGAPHIWHVGTVNPDGSPHVSPMWVGLDGDLVLFNTSRGRMKERNLRREPRVFLSHADTDNPFDRVQIRGRAVRFVEGAEADRTMDRLAQSYLGTAYEWLFPGEERVTVFIEPTRVRHVVGVEPLPSGAPGAAAG
ncbi:PPOX class F420-dependent oxidoreductase [Streptomyces diacarni]|uniref:PPOX class F420-dependent oxidoreductase n=1 Tax=Streptomyces diacarni TaxID=2800381 RepID=A0A367EPR4_9ACTN|nr:PPOX class F420-dependent oxidoreductase [Streptomyces diacarni]RCG19719.1 PPOX class F420-dependent oxidoreductase [Streptomyces diacarni]